MTKKGTGRSPEKRGEWRRDGTKGESKDTRKREREGGQWKSTDVGDDPERVAGREGMRDLGPKEELR